LNFPVCILLIDTDDPLGADKAASRKQHESCKTITPNANSDSAPALDSHFFIF
jgi:hypothetical protein